MPLHNPKKKNNNPKKKLGTVPLDPQIEGGPSTIRLKSGMIISDKDLINKRAKEQLKI